MGRGVAWLCVLAGGFVCAAALGFVPKEFVVLEAPRHVAAGGGAVLMFLGFLSLSRDHRASDTLATLLLLIIAAGAGWLTFYAPEGTLNRYVPFVPPSVNEALARLLFGLGTAVCAGMAFWALRRILR